VPLPAGVDRETLYFLERHETRVHSLAGRQIRDLGDALVLHDPIDREPFWNRAAAIRWPFEPAAFDRRLAETITLFAVLDRIPHVWPRPAWNEPTDLVDRLLANGWEDLGGGYVMLLTDPVPAQTAAVEPLPPGVTVERLGAARDGTARTDAADVAQVLAEAFAVEPAREASIEIETLATWDRPWTEAYLARVDGEPAAVAKRTTLDGASYVSSVGTRPAFRGRGLARLVTAAAAADGVASGSRLTYLGVYAENEPALRLYRGLGFETIGDPTPDLLLR
jgi:ribosomal protein S18 acetylase RimI-like enzyme